MPDDTMPETAEQEADDAVALAERIARLLARRPDQGRPTMVSDETITAALSLS